ncbi:ATP-binding cassette domain-containing protein [Ponticoccus sp. SC2-23]|uniref:ABC-F family ATP-binding cassette domain-containing protein n=1 Tax=Alexandriicola marinus TaxID=2081710 RepID=UPI000FD93E87|nr:ATP-binding cassette domain-containing protein [Alexandriicola marinus]MBM1219109.1 ATP-binding cassette domain-containing protein [Ponticoccus sp. SC6-9]MBM1223819.1 ATP-binding cassette domain-containing protein [Ponticoccus sp. SC6-15]MBM1228923.1 ATP-binding cassette domain-containing protein [Ponticoccus sp. SC6-38]MBM1232785.1 ATP-binding cassette domain-containing protein [Ponticoccus sp. SC6-45]MBM1237265.1 ATP-binding cassette domain-containing protein [Ponticoccus sp. SC6-49]MBM1
MARAPLLQLTDISLTFGGDPVFDDLSLAVQSGERIALVGRNGSGKSTLMKVMAGLVEPDRGTRVVSPGTGVGYMEQDPDMSGSVTLGDFAARDLDPGEAYKIEIAAEGLKFDPSREVSVASGGERRRAALARLMAQAPDLMLLDEPTNHLDIEAIGWLEGQLSETRAAFVLISHDRAFLRALTRSTLWIDRGAVRRRDAGFDGFEEWRDKVWEDEDTARHKLNRKIKAEARWAVEGISARRKRNMGRVRALHELRAERAAQIKRQGAAALSFEAGQKSGRKVIEAKGLSKTFGGQKIVTDFTLTVQRGDRVAFVGPNGVGKTTLIRMLLGQLEPDAGQVTHGTNLDIAVFDQSRSALDPEMSLWDSLVGDPAMRVSGKADQVMVRGTPRHVVGYLKDFLFDESRARAPVRSLSGGEKARLLLARLMAQPSNLLVLDEPTNDLDIETLDLLQDILGEYDGTVLLVSHDRDFLDRTATTTVAMEGNGRAVVYAGGWSDYRTQRGEVEEKPEERPASHSPKTEKYTSKVEKKPSLSFTEKHRLAALPDEIARLEAEIAKLGDLLSDPQLFSREPVKFKKATEALTERQAKLAAAEEEWLLLEEKAEG